MKVRFFDPGKGYAAIKDEIDEAMHDVLARGDLVLRRDVEEFEENLARYVGTKYAVAVSSGTDALVLALKAIDVRSENVIVPAHTFKATAGAVETAGGSVIVRDMDGAADRTGAKAEITVHIAGEVASLPNGNIRRIEDACQALGAIRNPQSDVQCWSFYPAKILGAYGDAGALTTDDPDIAGYGREARNHFKGDNRDFGGNHRMDNLQAAILNVKFRYLPNYLARREAIARQYLNGLTTAVLLPFPQPGRVWQDFIIRTERRDALHECLAARGIETLKNEYPWCSAFAKPPVAKRFEAETLRLPCNPDLTDDEVAYVIEHINGFFA